MCGTSDLPELVENLRFTEEDIAYLASLEAPAGWERSSSRASSSTCAASARISTSMPCPRVKLVFPREPMVRVMGPALECQLIETALLNTINFQTLVATKTVRVVQAGKGSPV